MSVISYQLPVKKQTPRTNQMAIITININSDPIFRNDLAIALVEESSPGYCGGLHYADPIEGKIYYKEPTALWNPCTDDTLVIPVYELADPNSDYSDQVDWNLADDLPWDEMIKAYLEEYDPLSFQKSEVIHFARNYSKEWAEKILEEEKDAKEVAVSFAKSEILDEVEIEIEN